MNAQNLDSEIITKVKSLNTNQKTDVLDYLENIPKHIHSTKMYRRKALKQIRAALQAT
ncbi:MAG: hypothetical protein ABJ004_04710 [Cyclobacteriaceae bacterium]